MNVIESVKSISNDLDNLQNYFETLNNDLSQVDSKICDIMHYIENNKIKTKGCYRLIQELSKLRIERRKIKNDMDLSRTFNTHLNKIISSDNRKFLLIELNKKNTQLNSKYKNRVYTEEEIKELVGE